MPANSKYLSSPKQRLLKVTAGILGGYLVTVTLHLALAYVFDHVTIIVTSSYTGFILWVILMILAFLVKNGWKIWAIYLTFSILFSIIIYFGKIHHPIVP